ncbi:hypothetical protein HK096_007472, partial [Nowakowskiella sp. JEL0078]
MDWTLWMLADSSLPTGGFVASSGLEAAAQCGIISSETLSNFIISSVHSYCHLTNPYVLAIHKSFNKLPCIDKERRIKILLNRFLKLDKSLNAGINNHVARRASIAQGSAFLTVLQRGFPVSEWGPENSGIEFEEEIWVKNKAVLEFRNIVR